MAQLRFFDAGRELFLHVLREGRTVIGRSDACDLALPSDSVSRVHCLIDRRGTEWILQDRSRHGTVVNGARVEQSVLSEGDEVGIGAYRARFTTAEIASTPTVPVSLALHEEIVQGTEQLVTTCVAELKFVRGAFSGRSQRLQQALCTVGGPGSTVELDEKLPKDAASLKVVRGRVMVGPGPVPTFLAGQPVGELTPVFPGEEVRVGDHGFVVEATVIEEFPREMSEFGEMVAESSSMRLLFGALQRMSSHDAPVLLTGESGTGKELAARGLHQAGPRYDQPFVAMNCAAIAERLFESELFGHEKGSFTGAIAQADGAFQRAQGGTLFLDEIGELHIDLQAKLLRALESGEVRRIGAKEPEYPNVRLISATNRNLPQMVRAGTFREDLYFRLAVLTIRIPSLRERPEDIPLIARTLLDRHHPGAHLTREALTALREHGWPGNVRELRNVLTRAVVMHGPMIGPNHLVFQPWSFEDEGRPVPVAPSAQTLPSEDEPEARMVLAALEQTNGNRTQAARLLGIPRTSLLYKINRYRLKVR